MVQTNITIKKDKILFSIENQNEVKQKVFEEDGKFTLIIWADFINSVIYLN